MVPSTIVWEILIASVMAVIGLTGVLLFLKSGAFITKTDRVRYGDYIEIRLREEDKTDS